ncbi:MAG TPA: flagellar export protein FliJ [Nitrospirae bacterium]|nr:flagellar export protein FliJ [Nitrospirota bacterium]
MKSDSLNNLLKLKEWRKEEIEMEINRLQGIINQEEARLKAMETELSGNLETFKNHQVQDIIDPGSLKTFHSYFSQMNIRMGYQREAIIKKIAELEETQKLLIEAYKEKMLVENLRGKLCLNETKANNRKEQKELDFIFTTRMKR